MLFPCNTSWSVSNQDHLCPGKQDVQTEAIRGAAVPGNCINNIFQLQVEKSRTPLIYSQWIILHIKVRLLK